MAKKTAKKAVKKSTKKDNHSCYRLSSICCQKTIKPSWWIYLFANTWRFYGRWSILSKIPTDQRSRGYWIT